MASILNLSLTCADWIDWGGGQRPSYFTDGADDVIATAPASRERRFRQPTEVCKEIYERRRK